MNCNKKIIGFFSVDRTTSKNVFYVDSYVEQQKEDSFMCMMMLKFAVTALPFFFC